MFSNAMDSSNKVVINPFYTGGLFHRFMLDKSICHFRASGLFCHSPGAQR